tara:strand:- start:643 stop:864 length:222 start_codon:yes stop_codon:yes gene_type:complete
MERYTLKEFKKVVEKSDIVYGQVSLNAAVSIPARIRKRSMLEQLDRMEINEEELGYFGHVEIDKKGRKILKVV